LVTLKDETFGLSRMFETFSEIKNIPYQLSVFRKMEEAYQWLPEDNDGL
jgi:hypothetical protein